MTGKYYRRDTTRWGTYYGGAYRRKVKLLIVDHIYESLISSSTSRGHSRALTASIIGACARRNWYVIKGFRGEGEVDPVLLMKFHDGNLYHDDISQLIAGCPELRLVDREFEVSCSGIYARVDGLVLIECSTCDMYETCWCENREGKVEHNIEIKSMDRESFLVFANNGLKAFPQYYAQCQVIVGSEPKRPLIFIAKDKSSSALMEELVEPDYTFIEKLIEQKKYFDGQLDRNMPPERQFGYTSVECKGCEYRFKCWFSKIRGETAVKRDIHEEDLRSIDRYIFYLRELEPFVREYDEYYNALRDFVATLHTKYSVRKIKLNNLNSSVVRTMTEKSNKEYIKSVLTKEELELAFYNVENTFIRTTPKL